MKRLYSFMAIWDVKFPREGYKISFQGKDTKLDTFLAKNQHTPQLLYFENRQCLNVKNWASFKKNKVFQK